MTTPKSTFRRIIFKQLRRAGAEGLYVSELYLAVASQVVFDSDDLRSPRLHGDSVNEPSWKRNVRNTLQSEKDRFRLSNFKKGWWKIAPGPEPGSALDPEGAWSQMLAAANKALQTGVIFRSPKQGKRYQIEDFADEQILVNPLDGGKQGRLKRAQVERAIRRLNASGSVTGAGTLINAVALEAALVSLHPHLQWSPDAERILTADSVQEGLPELSELEEEEVAAHISGAEGAVRLQTHRRRERNRALINKCKSHYLQQNGGRAPCQACGFDFSTVYGEIGVGFIEAHHIKALSSTDPNTGTTTGFEDIAFLCANCHRMSHRLVDGKWPTLRQLQELIRAPGEQQ